MKLTKTRVQSKGAAFAYSSEDEEVLVSPENKCLSCHPPESTHQRFSAELQFGGPYYGAAGGVVARDSSKAELSFSAGYGLGAQVTVTERVGLPTIVVDSTKVDSTKG